MRIVNSRLFSYPKSDIGEIRTSHYLLHQMSLINFVTHIYIYVYCFVEKTKEERKLDYSYKIAP